MRNVFYVIALVVTLLLFAPATNAFVLNELGVDLPYVIGTPITFIFNGYGLQVLLDEFTIEWESGTDIYSSSSINSSGFTNTLNNTITVPYIFPNVTLIYNMSDNQTLKELVYFYSKPYTVASDDNIYVTSEFQFDPDYLDLYANGQVQNGDFYTNGTIQLIDEDGVMARITFPRPYAIDADGNLTYLSYYLDYFGILGFFESWRLSVVVPVSVFENATYPLIVDPSAVTGCTETATTIQCHSGTFSGNFIHTTKNISISSATINGLNVDGSKDGQVILNSTGGWINITDSTINAYGDSGVSVQAGQGELRILNAPRGLNITNSLLKAYGGSVSSHFAGGGYMYILTTGNISINNNVGLLSYGGNCNYFLSCAGAGYFEMSTNGSITFTGSNTNITAYGGTVTEGGTTGGNNYAWAGASSTCYITANRFTNLNGLSNLQMFCNAAGSGGSRCEASNPLSVTGGSGLLVINSSFTNISFDMYMGGQSGAQCSGGTATTGSSTLKFNNINARTILFNGGYQGATSSPIITALGNEFSIFNRTLFGNTDAIYFNVTKDVGRIGLFSNSTYGSGGSTVRNLATFGALIVNNTMGSTTSTGFTEVSRNLSNYYYPIHNLNSPSNGANALGGLITFNSTYYSEHYTPANMTFYIWNSDGSLFNKTTNTVSGGENSTWVIVNISQNGLYYWNALLTSQSNIQQLWYGSSNYSLSVGTFVNNITASSSAYQTETQTYRLNITVTGSPVSTAKLWYNNQSFSSTVSTDTMNTYLTNTIDVPGEAPSNTYYWWQINRVDGTTSNLTIYNQTVNPILFGYCNSTLNTTYLNFTFADENTLNAINGSIDQATFTYYLGTGSANKTLFYSNNTVAPSRAFCYTPTNQTVNVVTDIVYSNSGYPARNFGSTFSLTNSTTNQILYLLASADGIYSSYHTVTQFGNSIPSVYITVEREISNVYYLIGSGYTDSSGTITFWLNPNYEHRIGASKEGYLSQSFTIIPSQSLYNIFMSAGEGNASYASDIAGMKWKIYPSSGRVSGTTTFGINLTAVNDNLVSCRMDLVLSSNSTILATTNGGTPSGCNLSIPYNIPTDVRVFGKFYVWTDDSGGYFSIDSDALWYELETNTSYWAGLRSFFDEWQNLPYYGDGEGELRSEYNRVIWFFLILMILVGIITFFTEYDKLYPGVMFGLITAVILIASQAGFFNFSFGNENVPEFFRKYTLAIIALLITLGYFIDLWSKEQRNG